MGFDSPGRLYNGIVNYFRSGSIDEFIITLAILATKHHKIFEDYKTKGSVLDKNAVEYFAEIRKPLKKKIDELNAYSYEGLRKCLNALLLQNISVEVKFSIARYFPKYSIDEGSGNVAYRYSAMDLRSLESDYTYGTNDYDPDIQLKKPRQSRPAVRVDRTSHVEPIVLQRWSGWQRINAENFHNFWSLRVSYDDYKSLKEFLKEVLQNADEKKMILYSRELSLYLAEWYKREYEGYGQGTYPAFASIGVGGSTRICKEMAEKEKYVVLRGNNMYQYSLYVLGGIPWKYVVAKKHSNFARNIGKLFKSVTDGDNSSIISAIAQDINNTAIRESICCRGSIYENLITLLTDETYVEYILNQFPTDASDINNFIKAVKEEVNILFMMRWRFDRRIVGGRASDTLVPLLCFTSKTHKGVIPKSVVRDCGVNLEKCTCFNLVARLYNSEGAVMGSKSWTHYRCASGDFSTSENYDGRIVANITSESDIPASIRVFIEDVPGPFGLKLDNGFERAGTEPIYKCENLDLIKFYGDIGQDVLYSNPKNAELYVLKRPFMTCPEQVSTLNAGAFEFIHITEPLTVNVKNRVERLSPYGTLSIDLPSGRWGGILDLSRECSIKSIDGKLYSEIEINDSRISDIQVVNHQSLSQLKVYYGDDELDAENYEVSYQNLNNDEIPDIDSYYGLVKLCLTYDKTIEKLIYLADIERDTLAQTVTVNSDVHKFTYDFQVDNSQIFTLGDTQLGKMSCAVFYPFHKEDVILTYPVRRVYRSSRYYEGNRYFYYTRKFDLNGCTETPLIASEYYDNRPEIKRQGDGTFMLTGHKVFGLPEVSDFYFYNTRTNEIQQAKEYVELKGRYYLVTTDEFRRLEDVCIVFQSMKNSTTDVCYKYTSNANAQFNSNLWSIIFEHNLLLEDFWEPQEDPTFELLTSYCQYAGSCIDFEYLRRIGISKKYSWLMLGKHFLMKFHSNKEFLINFLCKTSVCAQGVYFKEFVEKYVANLKKVYYTLDKITKKTPVKELTAYVLSGNSVWALEDDRRAEMFEYLQRDRSYKELMKILKLK